MTENEKVITDSIIDITSNDFVIVEKGDFQNFQKAAKKFIDEVLLYYKQSLRTKNLIKTENLNFGLQYFYQYMRENTIFTKNILQLQQYFENQLNNFLGRKINLAWVSKDGHIIFIDEANINQIYKRAFGQFGRGGISESVLKNLKSNIEETLIKKFQKSQSSKIGVYLEIKSRWEEPKNKKRFYYYGYFKNFNRRKYTKRFSTLGSIAEGYVNAVVNEDEEIVWDGEKTEKSENSIRRLYEKHIELDSVAAAIKGDIVYNVNNGDINIHFAAKEGSFSTAKFGQFFALAQKILQMQPLAKENFQSQLKQNIKVDSTVQAILQEAYDEAIKMTDNNIKIN